MTIDQLSAMPRPRRDESDRDEQHKKKREMRFVAHAIRCTKPYNNEQPQ